MLLGGWAIHPAHDEVDVACVQFSRQHPEVADDDVKRHPWVLLGEAMDHGRINGCYRVFAPSYAYFAYRRIVKRRDILHALPQFVEHGDAALDKRAAKRSRLHALPAPVEQAHTER